MIERWQDSPVIDPETHGQLLADVDYYAQLAGIRSQWIWQPLSEWVGPRELAWVSGYRTLATRGCMGLWFTGKAAPAEGHPPVRRMEVIVGTLVRNFVDARLRCLDDALDGQGDHASVLAIPDFCTGPGKVFATRQSAVASLLLRRASQARQTVLYATSEADLLAAYGDTVRDLVNASFQEVPL